MTTPNELRVIFEKMADGTATNEDIETLRQVHEGNKRILIQYGKSVVNIGQGQGVQIGDRTYVELNDKALQALIQAIGTNRNNDLQDNYFIFAEACSDRQSIDKYFEIILHRLRQQGSLDIRQNFVSKGRNFNYIAKIADFEIPFGFFSMRGEAFFMFSEFASINIKTLQQFSAQCMHLAQKQVNPSAIGQAVWNLRVPTHLCFAIAIVDKVDEKTKTEVMYNKY